MKISTPLVRCLAAIGLAVAVAGPALAKYPDRPITMIVAYSAGGGTDIAARTLAPYIEKYLGGHIVVEDRPGASGVVGFTALSQAKPDGYTIGFINTPSIMTAQIAGRAPYKMSDFAPIANVVSDPDAFSVRKDSKIKNLKDLVKYAKAHPEDVTFGTTGIGSDDQLAALAFERQTGVKMTHVPYPGNAPVRSALLGNHITLAVMNISEAVDDMNAGRIRVLGQMGEEPWDQAPKVPTFKSQGYDIEIGSDRGIAAPAGVPDDIKEKLATAIKKAMNDPEFQKKAKEQYLPLNYLDPKGFTKLLDDETDRFQKIWNDTPWVEN